ncbi:MAG TPA: STAS domain-containing protein [Spirochaetia bacterium]|nr:STAS domain-containing protein [Spirochaetia bacterium]
MAYNRQPMESEEKDDAVIQVRQNDNGEIEVLPMGHLARENMEDLQARLDEALSRARGVIVLNFENLRSLNSTAIGKILKFKTTCDQKRIRLIVRHCNPDMLQLLKMIKFDSLVQMEN